MFLLCKILTGPKVTVQGHKKIKCVSGERIHVQPVTFFTRTLTECDEISMPVLY